MSKIVFIVNPHAGNGSTGSTWPLIESLAKDRIGPFEAYMTKRPGDAVILAKNAAAEKVRLLVGVGGDGTLNEVINGVMMHEEFIRSNVTLGFIPKGTGCDFVRTVSIPQGIEQAVDLIASGSVRSIDLGVLDFRDHDGRDRCRYFHNIASFGLGGQVARRVNQTTKTLGPFISFMWATLISIFLYGKKRIRIRIDNGFKKEMVVWNVAVANGQYHGGGMWVAPNASMFDGLLNITIIGDLTIPEVFLNLSRLYNGRICDIDNVITLAGKTVAAASDDRVYIEMDGEQAGLLPAKVKIVPGALKIIAK
ncbi:MAG: diacylglycerol kinase family lipid kinase [Desulfobacterales bacterium]